MTEDEKDRELARSLARQFDDLARELQQKADELHVRHAKTQTRVRFLSRAPADMWQMPKWLWIPLVGALTGLFLLALFVAGGGHA